MIYKKKELELGCSIIRAFFNYIAIDILQFVWQNVALSKQLFGNIGLGKLELII